MNLRKLGDAYDEGEEEEEVVERVELSAPSCPIAKLLLLKVQLFCFIG